MNLLEQFINFLKNQKKKPSFLTVKNYKADIGQFISWFEKEIKLSFDPLKINLQTLETYKKSRQLSPSSIERHTSSLRKFFKFLKTSGIISYDPLEKKSDPAQAQEKENPWMLRNFKSFLYEYKKSPLTIKNYINDIKNFFLWLEKASLAQHAWKVTEANLLSKINFSVIEEYKKRLIESKFAARTINRRLSSLRSYMAWAKTQGLILSGHPEFISGSSPAGDFSQQNKILKQVEDAPRGIRDGKKEYSSFPPIRLMQKSISGFNFLFDNLFIFPLVSFIYNLQYFFWKATKKDIFTKSKYKNVDQIFNIQKSFFAPLDVSLHYFPVHKKLWHYIRHVRPNWYKKYHSYSISHYLHFAILLILSTTVGFGIYSGLFQTTGKESSLAEASTNASSRMLSFQGKLSDRSNNPIAIPARVIFSIYNSKNAPISSFLWRETNSIKPDQNGLFSVLLGKNNLIPEALFSQNPLFLGIAIDGTSELNPRQELATAFLSKNTQTLQGLEPITNTEEVSNVVLALDSSGNLNIQGPKTHTFQAIGGNFVLSGNILSLTTVTGSDTDVKIAPDGLGKIDLSKPIHNSSDNNNLSGAPGAVEFDDNVAILATSSAASALVINQNSIGPLISASSSGIAKFTLENDGKGIFAGDLEINGDNLISSSSAFYLFDSLVTTLNIGGSAETINLGAMDGSINMRANLKVKKDLSISSLTSKGGILYTNESGKILQVSAGSSSDCLRGGETPVFAPCNSSDLSSADIAEYYGSEDRTIEPGDIVIATDKKNKESGNKAYVRKSNNSYQTSVIGIVSTNPYQAFGKNFDSSEHSFPVTLAGRIPVKISLENGHIKAGDLLAASSIPGVAAKAIKAGTIIGKALEDLDSIDDEKTVGFYNPDNQEYRSKTGFPDIPTKSNIVKIGKINAFANISWYDPNTYLAQNGNLVINNKEDNYSISSLDQTLTNIGGFFEVVSANIKAGLIETKQIVAQSLIVTSDSIIVNGQNLKEYITGIVNESPLRQGFGGQASIISPIVKTNELATNIISPLAKDSDISISLEDSQLSIHDSANASGSAVAAIDSQGNASFSGQLQSDSLLTNKLTSDEASVSGTLRADKIIADNIEGLEKQDFSFLTSHSSSDYVNLASYSAQMLIEDIKAERGQFNQGLMVFGATSLLDASITDQLSIGGSMFLQNNSIESLGTDLSLQSLRQGGLSIMAGLVYIDTDGNIKIQGDLSVSGKLAVNIISPLPNSNLIVNNASGSGILSVNQTGDVIASGSGTFSKLNLSLVQPALALSPTEFIASSSAGSAEISQYQTEVTIRNKLVTKESVIYITPVGTPSAQAPFLMRQTPNELDLPAPRSASEVGSEVEGSFTVGVQSPTRNLIPFNWLIVN